MTVGSAEPGGAERSEQRARRRAAFLAAADVLPDPSLDHLSVVASIARLAVSLVGDTCSLLEIADDTSGWVSQVAVAGATPELDAGARELARWLPERFPPQGELAEVLGHGERRELSVPLSSVTSELPGRPLARTLGLRRILLVPLVTRGQILGALAVNSRKDEPFTSEEIRIAEAIADRAAAAIADVRLYRVAQSSRSSTERALEREALLARVGEIFASSTDYATTVAQAARLAVPFFGDACAVLLRDGPDGPLRVVAHVAADPEIQRLIGRVIVFRPMLERWSTVAAALADGHALIVQQSDERIRELAENEEHLSLLRALGITESLMVPLQARGAILGALSFLALRGRRCERDNLPLAEELGRRAGTAIDNARLFREAQEARAEAERALHRASFLATAGEALGGSIADHQATVERIARLAVPRLGDVCIACEVEDQDALTLRRVALAGRDQELTRASAEQRRAWPAPHSPSAGLRRILEEGRACVIRRDGKTLAGSPFARQVWESGVESTIIVPLHVGERLAGVLAIHALGEKEQGREEVGLAEELGRRAAMALDNARLYAEARGARDVAEKALRAQRESEDRFRAVVENANAVIWLKDLDGRYVFFNRAYERVFGVRAEEWLGKTSNDRYPRELAEVLLANDRKVLESREPIQVEEPVPTRSPRIWLTNKFPILGRDGELRGLGGVATDITERKQLEAELRQAQKMEAVGRLAGGVAHDFNNLLTVMTGYCEALLASDPRDVRVHTERLMEAVDRARALTGRMLAFSRRRPTTQVTFDLNGGLAAMATILRRVIGEDVQLELTLSPEPALVHGSPSDLEQVVLNLAINARDAMPRGGRLSIETAIEGRSGERGDVVLRVRDTGVGIPAGDLGRIFEPFFTTKEPGRGTGLGLSTAKRILESGGGSIRVDSEVGRGTRFEVRLPPAGKPLSSSESEPAKRAPEGGTETILVVEDDREVLEYVRETLEAKGYRVVAAGNPTVAIDVAASYPGHIDLLLSDVVMPQMNGREMADRLAKVRPQMRALHMSGYMGDALDRHDVESVALLHKPFTRDGLLRKVREVLDRAGG